MESMASLADSLLLNCNVFGHIFAIFFTFQLFQLPEPIENVLLNLSDAVVVYLKVFLLKHAILKLFIAANAK